MNFDDIYVTHTTIKLFYLDIIKVKHFDVSLWWGWTEYKEKYVLVGGKGTLFIISMKIWKLLL